MDRETWLAERRKGLGSSDAAAACGVSRWGSPLHVYISKVQGVDLAGEGEHLRLGLLLEPVVARLYEERKGVALDVPVDPIWRHEELSWMIATPDRFSADGKLVELKTARTGEGWGPEDSDHIPTEYMVQVQHQMAVTGATEADVAVLIAGCEFRVYTIVRNEDIIVQLVAQEGDLWDKIRARRPPEPDWRHPDTPKLLDLLHRPAEGKVVELPAEMAGYAGDYAYNSAIIKAADETRTVAKARLIAAMGDASTGILPDGRTITRKIVPARAISYERGEYTTFHIRNPRKGNDNGTTEE